MTAVERLIKTFIPEHYNLFLDLDRTNKTFQGNVAITGEALDHDIGLHQKDLTIQSVLLDGLPLDFSLDNAAEKVAIHLPETGSMTLLVEFSGQITDTMTGIYPSYYSFEGETREIIATQFESHFAREAFPCIDEPEAKATFDFSLKFDQMEGEIALSNMPEINLDRRLETGVWAFDTSPRMSTYLLAFACGRLQSKTSYTKKGVEIGVFATPAQPADSLDFALEMTGRLIDFYEDYFGVGYPLPICYQLALPDFSAGAMENWGLITYRELYLLVDKNATAKSRQEVALTIAHEVAHQWFGNLVTMAWWDDLWLNESFANMMEFVAVDALEPDFKIFENFQTSGIRQALKRDATDGVQSVHVEVTHPDQVNTLFDPAIVYAKGSRLMHMLHRWIGGEAFRAGLTAYFQKHQYRNTVGRDLWKALGEAAGKDVASFMDAWLEQPGYPLLTARVEEDQLILSQKQFFIGDHEDKNRLWQIPLNSSWTGLPDILTEAEVVIPNFSQLAAKNQGPLLFNTQNTAHYLTNYEGDLLTDIFGHWLTLDRTTKLQILQERLFLAEAGLISYADLVVILEELTQEDSYLVLSGISASLAKLGQFIDEGSQAEAAYLELLGRIFQRAYETYGFEPEAGEADEVEMVRQLTLTYLTKAKYQPVLDQLSQLYQTYEDRLESLPASIRQLVLTHQLQEVDSKDLAQHYLTLYRQTQDSNFRYQLAAALSKTKNQASLDLVLQSFTDKEVIKPQDLAMAWYLPFLANDFSRDKVWEWACANWDWVMSALGGDMSVVKFVSYPALYFKTQEQLAAYRSFFEPQLDHVALNRAISMGIKEISARCDLIAKDKEAVNAALLSLDDLL